MSRLSLALLVMSAILAAAGQILFKLGADGRHEFADFLNIFILSGLVAYCIGTVVWIYVLSSERLINVFAFSALTFVLVYLGSTMIDGRGANAPGLVGTGLILVGLYLLTNYNT